MIPKNKSHFAKGSFRAGKILSFSLVFPMVCVNFLLIKVRKLCKASIPCYPTAMSISFLIPI